MNIEWTVGLLIALGIGTLIGLEREQSESAGSFAGVRTFPLVALLGALMQLFFPSLLPIMFGMFLLLVTIAYISKIVIEGDVGMTTTLAMILTFIYGAMTVHSDDGLTLAIVLGTVTTAFLAVKDPCTISRIVLVRTNSGLLPNSSSLRSSYYRFFPTRTSTYCSG